VGSGNCLFWAPATFDLDDGGTSVVVDPAGDDEDRIRVAVDGCPTRAITLEPVGTDAPTDAPTDVPNEGEPDADRSH
jgi:ferredoxin